MIHAYLKERGSDSRRSDVYAHLHRQIIDLSLKPGAVLSEKEIALQFNVSRTPVREALILLAKEGLVEILPQVGTYVSLINPELVEESRFMREALETAAIRLAAEQFRENELLQLEHQIRMQQLAIREKDYKALINHDDTFHRIIFWGLGKERSWNALEQMNGHFKRVRFLRLSTSDPEMWTDILTEHMNLVEALRKKDARLAEKLMKEHLTKGIFHMDELKKKYPGYFKK